MGQVRGQLRGEFVHDVAEPLVAVARIGRGRVDGRQQRLDDGMLGFQGVGQGHPVGPAGHAGAQRRPQRVVLGLVVDDQELLEELPPQGGAQQLTRVVVAQPRDPSDLRELTAQGVVHREHHAHVELVVHRSSSVGLLIMTLSLI